jgi:hypothetical protein
MPLLKPNESRIQNSLALIIVILVLDILGLIIGFLNFSQVQSAISQNFNYKEDVNIFELFDLLIAIIRFFAMVASTVLFILWFRRAYFNLHLLVPNLEHKEGWAAGGWFVPILSLFIPYQIMRDLFNHSLRLLNLKGNTTYEYVDTKIVGGWWALYLVSGFMQRISTRYSLRAETNDEYLASIVFELISIVISIVLALVVIKLIKTYERIEKDLHSEYSKIDELTEVPNLN